MGAQAEATPKQRRLPRSEHEVESHAVRVQRAAALMGEGLSWDVIAERLGLEEGDESESMRKVATRMASEAAQQVELYGLAKSNGRWAVVRVVLPVSATEPLLGRTPQGQLSVTTYPIAVGRVQAELGRSAQRLLQGKVVAQ
jgi:hypothetical protein